MKEKLQDEDDKTELDSIDSLLEDLIQSLLNRRKSLKICLICR
jgi:hypothetical protein